MFLARVKCDHHELHVLGCDIVQTGPLWHFLGLVQRASSFNGDMSKWDVSKVTDMYSMFDSASSFNGDISKWDVSSVENVKSMFSQAELFNCDISKWDV